MNIEKCKTKIPSKLNNKVCVRPGMGGNAEMINHTISTKEVACAKKYDKHEVYFYKTMNRYRKQKTIKSLIPYLPKYHGECTAHDEVFFVMENLVKTSSSKFMDLKIGYKSALRKESNWVKYTRHYFIDHLFSISSNYGFRLEGVNFQVKKTRSTGKTQLIGDKKYGRYVYHPLDIFQSFFDSKSDRSKENSVSKTISQIKDMVNNFARPNLRIIKGHLKQFPKKGIKDSNISGSNLLGIGLIGASLFIIKEPRKLPKVKLIDFAHPTIITKTSPKKDVKLALEEAENFLRGLEGFLIMLYLFEEEI
jgi:hypothetical protein